MSGIFGIVHFDGKIPAPKNLELMRHTMAHRGPDGSHIALTNNAGFGHLMLCSTPESQSEQLPWTDPLSQLLITADARIDNRKELRAALSLTSRSNVPLSDSQLILAAFEKWGTACVDHLLGDFAFAIWDPHQQQLFIARDPMGVRPFYYYPSKHYFVFASAANAVRQASQVPGQINEGRIADFLISELEGINNTSTFYQNIYRLPPAHFGLIKNNSLSIQSYWTPNPETQLQLKSDNDYADALEEALTRAIKARMRSQHPPASMLSGGVDSSTVCGIASKLNIANGQDPFRTYSGVSDDVSHCDESGFIRSMIDHGGLDPVLIPYGDIKSHPEKYNRISELTEDPFDENWLLLRSIYLSAKAHGNVAVMDGMGGDIIAGCTDAYPAYLFRQGNIKQGLDEIKGLQTHYFEHKISSLKGYTQIIRPTLTPQLLRKLKASFRVSPWAREALNNSMLSKDYAQQVELKQRWQEYRNQSTLGFCASLRHAHAESIAAPYVTAAIERYERIASYCGVESRQPFHDKRVVELCLSLPWQQKAQHGWMKYGLRNVLQRVAPVEVAWRSRFDSIMWKFNRAWYEQNQQKNNALIAENRARLSTLLDDKKLELMLHQSALGDHQAREAISNVATLLRWLPRNTA